MHEFNSFDPSLLSALAMAAGEDNVVMSEPMRAHTTFKIGGPADVFVTPETPRGARARARRLRDGPGSRPGGGQRQ